MIHVELSVMHVKSESSNKKVTFIPTRSVYSRARIYTLDRIYTHLHVAYSVYCSRYSSTHIHRYLCIYIYMYINVLVYNITLRFCCACVEGHRRRRLRRRTEPHKIIYKYNNTYTHARTSHENTRRLEFRLDAVYYLLGTGTHAVCVLNVCFFVRRNTRV